MATSKVMASSTMLMLQSSRASGPSPLLLGLALGHNQLSNCADP